MFALESGVCEYDRTQHDLTIYNELSIYIFGFFFSGTIMVNFPRPFHGPIPTPYLGARSDDFDGALVDVGGVILLHSHKAFVTGDHGGLGGGRHAHSMLLALLRLLLLARA